MCTARPILGPISGAVFALFQVEAQNSSAWQIPKPDLGPEKSGHFLHILGDFLTKLHIKTWRKRKRNPLEKIIRNPVETAPRNCRFLSLVVVERALTIPIKDLNLDRKFQSGCFYLRGAPNVQDRARSKTSIHDRLLAVFNLNPKGPNLDPGGVRTIFQTTFRNTNHYKLRGLAISHWFPDDFTDDLPERFPEHFWMTF